MKPSNVLRPPVKEMMFDVVWSLQSQRVAPQLSSSTFVSLSLLSCSTKTSFRWLYYQQNHKIRHSSSCLEPSCHHFSEKKLQLFYSSSSLLLLSFLESKLPRNHHSWVWQLELDTPIDILLSEWLLRLDSGSVRPKLSPSS